jgi:FKBP-type peptidyl-prolyl cis-trans isomerase
MKTSFSLVAALMALLVSCVAAGTNPEGIQWLATKKTEQGVVALPSGLLYKEIRAGT